MFIVIAAGSTSELKRELSAFDDKVTRMERSLHQVTWYYLHEGLLCWSRSLVIIQGHMWENLTGSLVSQNFSFVFLYLFVPSVLWCCWLGVRKGIQPIKIWLMRCWRGYLLERSANSLHMVQLMPLPPHHVCFSKIHSGLSFWKRLTWVVIPGQMVVKRL